MRINWKKKKGRSHKCVDLWGVPNQLTTEIPLLASFPVCTLDICNIREPFGLCLWARSMAFLIDIQWQLTYMSKTVFFFFFYSPAEVYLSQMLVDLFETAGISITQATLLWRLQIRGRQGQIITPPAQECLCVLVEKTFDSFLCSDMLQCTPNTIYTFNKGLGCKTPSDFILPNL